MTRSRDSWSNERVRARLRPSEAVPSSSGSENPAWTPQSPSDKHQTPADALEFATAPPPSRPSPLPSSKATPPCAALQAVLTCFSLHQRASYGRPLTRDEQRLLRRIEQALRSADIRSRRRWKRHGASRPIRIDASGRGSMVDLSAGGLRIDNASSFPAPGSLIDVSMRVSIHGNERTLVFPSRVSWLDSRTGSLGVSFVAPARWETPR